MIDSIESIDTNNRYNYKNLWFTCDKILKIKKTFK